MGIWLLPCAIIQAVISFWIVFTKTVDVMVFAILGGYGILPIVILLTTFCYAFVSSVRKSLYTGPIWLSFFLSLANLAFMI